MTEHQEHAMDDTQRDATVKALLTAAGLDLPDDEVAAFVGAYDGVRAGRELLHAVSAANDLDGALVLRPTDAAYAELSPADGGDSDAPG